MFVYISASGVPFVPTVVGQPPLEFAPAVIDLLKKIVDYQEGEGFAAIASLVAANSDPVAYLNFDVRLV